jgi:hypothetical protein
MRTTTAVLLARPSAGAERGRILLIAAAAAVASGLLIAVARIARVPVIDSGFASAGVPSLYVSDSSTRFGVMIGAGLLAIPVLAFAVQALRVGSVARDRRMAALRLAGATPRDVRMIAAAEAGGAAFVGGLFAAWVYPLLWVLLGVLPPADLRLLPDPEGLDVAVWLGVTVIAAIGGAAAGAAVQQRVIVEPLAIFRHANRHRTTRSSVAAMLVGPLLVIGSVLYLETVDAQPVLVYVVMLIGIVVTAMASGPRLVRRRGRKLRQHGGTEDLLAGWRLEAEPEAPGRVAAVLILCGVALGIEGPFLASFVIETGGGAGSYLGLLATLATVLGIVVAVLTLIVGAADQLLDARLSLATLAAMGVDEASLSRVLHRQLSATAVPAARAGVLVAGVGLASVDLIIGELLAAMVFLAASLVAAVVAWCVVSAAARLATRMLASRLHAAIDAENLRVG